MNGGEEIVSQLTSSAMIVYAIEYLKRSRWCTWITADTKTLNRWLCLLGSLVAAVGVHYSYDGSATTGWTFTFIVPPVSALVHGVWHLAQQYAGTQVIYDATVAVKPTLQSEQKT